MKFESIVLDFLGGLLVSLMLLVLIGFTSLTVEMVRDTVRNWNKKP